MDDSKKIPTTEPLKPNTTMEINQVEAVVLILGFLNPIPRRRQKDSLNQKQAAV